MLEINSVCLFSITSLCNRHFPELVAISRAGSSALCAYEIFIIITVFCKHSLQYNNSDTGRCFRKMIKMEDQLEHIRNPSNWLRFKVEERTRNRMLFQKKKYVNL